MERKFYTDNFEQLLKEKSDEFRMYPSKRVWHSIYNDLHPGRKWPSIAVSMLLITSLLLVSYWNSNNNVSKKIITDNITFQSNSGNSTEANELIANQNTDLIADDIQMPLLAVSAKNNSLVVPQSEYINHNNRIPNIISSASSKVALTFTGETANTLNNKSNYTFLKEKNIDQQADNALKTTTVPEIVDEPVSLVTIDLTVKNNNTGIPENNNNNSSIYPDKTETNTTVTEKSIGNTQNIIVANNSEDKILKTNSVTSIKNVSADDKAWMEAYAFNNKPKRKKWKDRTAAEFYVTPGIGYRKFTNNTTYNTIISNPLVLASTNSANLNDALNHQPGLGLEAGAGLVYSVAKNIRVKAGIQANYTNYVIIADETNHPILTTLMFNNPINGYPYMEARSSLLSNNTGFKTVKVHNQTYQISIPVGLAVKLTGNQKLEWYAGATIQPTFIIGGKANVISSDRRNYVSDPSLIRHWGLNSGFETYLHYKLAGYTLQVGPQFRYQLVSTYSQKYTLKENLFNTGLKIGVIKNL